MGKCTGTTLTLVQRLRFRRRQRIRVSECVDNAANGGLGRRLSGAGASKFTLLGNPAAGLTKAPSKRSSEISARALPSISVGFFAGPDTFVVVVLMSLRVPRCLRA